MNHDTANTSQATILVVDDSPDNLRVLSKTLARGGYKIRCVTTGEMALVSISYLPPDLILLDIRMPTMDGYEVCRQLKANPATSDIPIIFLSAADDIADKVKAFTVGGIDYITKPFQSEEVLARITNQLTIQKLQNQLAERNHRLQQEIDEHKRTEVALQDAKEAAEVANYAKSEFLARMSHELRTPLNAILGFSELMQSDSSLSAEYQDYLASINQSGQYLLKLLDRILTVTNAESSKVSLNQQDFDLHHLLDEIAPIFQQKAIAKGLKLTIECPTTVPQYIRSDENKLRQVLMNLLENAIQFTSQGRVILRVKAERGRGDEIRSTPLPAYSPVPLFFEVEDTGSGIASYEMNRLFQAFSQTETGQKTGQGLGLGLFINRQFVQVMGGDITISSAPAQGTIARFYILVHLGGSDSVTSPPWVQAGDRAVELMPSSFSEPCFNCTTEQISEALYTVMSADWLTQLHQAAVKGFDHQISQLIREIPATHASSAKVLTDWNQNFQFDKIVTITQQILEQTL